MGLWHPHFWDIREVEGGGDGKGDGLQLPGFEDLVTKHGLSNFKLRFDDFLKSE